MADCYTNTKASKVKVEENGKSAIFLNPARQRFTKVRLDGCLIKNAPACDWVVVRNEAAYILIELKGTDVDRALVQIEASFEYLERENILRGKCAALIICSHPSKHPSFTSKLQKVRARLSSKYRAPLHVVTGQREFEVDRVMVHSGPF